MSSKQEKIYYQDEAITITNARAVLGEKTYSMANITSVSSAVVPATKELAAAGTMRLVAMGLMFMTLCTTLFAFALLIDDGNPMCFVFTVALGAAGWFILKKAKEMEADAKNRHAVKIGSASGEQEGFVAKDEAYIKNIVAAMNEAIIERG